jgi:hypothetical protein
MYDWPDFTLDWNAIASGGGCPTRKEDGDDDAPC